MGCIIPGHLVSATQANENGSSLSTSFLFGMALIGSLEIMFFIGVCERRGRRKVPIVYKIVHT
jgi:hypothetical protein